MEYCAYNENKHMSKTFSVLHLYERGYQDLVSTESKWLYAY
jgi:hypothetical protein